MRLDSLLWIGFALNMNAYSGKCPYLSERLARFNPFEYVEANQIPKLTPLSLTSVPEAWSVKGQTTLYMGESILNNHSVMVQIFLGNSGAKEKGGLSWRDESSLVSLQLKRAGLGPQVHGKTNVDWQGRKVPSLVISKFADETPARSAETMMALEDVFSSLEHAGLGYLINLGLAYNAKENRFFIVTAEDPLNLTYYRRFPVIKKNKEIKSVPELYDEAYLYSNSQTGNWTKLRLSYLRRIPAEEGVKYLEHLRLDFPLAWRSLISSLTERLWHQSGTFNSEARDYIPYLKQNRKSLTVNPVTQEQLFDR